MTVTVDAVVYFNVVTAELALCSVDDYRLRKLVFLFWPVNGCKVKNFEKFGLLCM